MWFGTWFRRMIRRIIREELPVALEVEIWRRYPLPVPAEKGTKACVMCNARIPLEMMTCQSCGTPQSPRERETTGHYKLPPFVHQFNTVTGQIEAAALPNERKIKTYNRIKEKNKRPIR